MSFNETRPIIEGQVALIVGVGPGLGAALARRFSEAGMRVAIAARRLPQLVEIMRGQVPESAHVVPFECDATIEMSVSELFVSVRRRWAVPDLVVYNAGRYTRGSIFETDVATLEQCWRVGCLGAFIVGRAAATHMARRGSGTILFSGASVSTRAAEGLASLAVEKFGLRALAQAMVCELGPRGIHVAHVVIDGRIVSEHYRDLARELPAGSLLAPGAIAENYLHLHRQHRSAWTHELDLCPWTATC